MEDLHLGSCKREGRQLERGSLNDILEEILFKEMETMFTGFNDLCFYDDRCEYGDGR